MAGIREVAREAGVSISTVSYALNGSDKISEETRQRVQEIAKGLGYAPKLAARTLKGSKTNIVGVYISGFQGEFYGELLDGMQHQFDLLGYDMMVSSGSRTHKFLSEKLFDGAIVLDTEFQTQELEEILKSGHKIVVLDRDMQHENVRTVLLDNISGSRQAVDYLLAQDLAHYFVISGPRGNHDAKARLEGAKARFQEAKVAFEVIEGDFNECAGYEAAKKIQAQVKNQTAGIYSLNDDQAIGFYRYMREHKLDLSAHYKLVGFDNNRSADFLFPTLPSISYHKHFWGETAARTLIELIENKKVSSKIINTQISFRE
ncbi:MAG: LacI family transcriptional regulator [Streptococcaceae bacterium]|jgi:LacI family transcriptional regulator|nr:LacI family transcriptional regulator [Streptococcaceae bacterium]